MLPQPVDRRGTSFASLRTRCATEPFGVRHLLGDVVREPPGQGVALRAPGFSNETFAERNHLTREF
ncbi:hypothetical protein D3C86_2004360 [compost metagenome]